MSLCDLAPDYIRDIAPYQAGKPISELAREMGLDEADIVKLASNENPLGMSPQALDAVNQAIAEIARYPDGNAFVLRDTISRHFGLNPAQLVFGNGSNDILELAARAFLSRGDEAIYAQHAFAVYALVTQAVGARGIVVPAQNFGHDLPAMLAAITPSTKLVFIANPNNPTGTVIGKHVLKDFLSKVPARILVVLDEAYDEYLPLAEKSEAMQWLAEFPNLLISRTFSKAYGLAGLRVGYGVGDPALIDIMNRVRQPFNVNSLAQVAAAAALLDADFVERSRALNQAGMLQITQGLTALGLGYIPSSGNFVSFRIPQAARVYQQLLRQGVIVRPVASYGMPEYLRVSIGLFSENAKFLTALQTSISTT